jgi:hypothetical protein
MVAGFVDDRASAGEVLARRGRIFFGKQEPGVAEVGIDFVEPKTAAFCGREGLVDVTAGTGKIALVGVKVGAREEDARQIVLPVGAAQVVDGLLEEMNG